MSKSTPRKSASAAPAVPAPAVDPDVAAMGYEEAVEELESIVERMERGDGALEDTLREYARGDALVRRCRQILEQAEQRIEAIGAADLDAGQDPRPADPPF
jgi:exodeoxyribonuclease VII small subunit